MAVLALDLGTKTGWALASGGTVICGTESFQPSRFQSSAMRFVRFRAWLTELHDASRIEHIGFEEVRRHAGVTAAHAYGGFMALLMEWAEVQGVPVEGFPVGTIKKSFTGSGNAPKGAMIAEARRRGFDVPDDNAADALAILYLMAGIT